MTYTNEEIAARGHPVWAEVDLDAIHHNVRVIGSLAPQSELMAVVKGYAYGHGNPTCARAMLAAGATRLGVARVAEAIHLREAGIGAPIHVFTEPPPEAVEALIKLEITPTVYTERFATALSEGARLHGAPVSVHLKIDTGMHRVGVTPDHVLDAVRVIKALPGIEIEGAWSHLAVADVPDHPFTVQQVDLYESLTEMIERAGTPIRYRHLANSAATLSLPESHFDIVRPGVAMFGLWPGRTSAPGVELRPAMALRARVNMVKDVPAGERLSYGLRYELRQDGRVATVPVGYADGYDRGFSTTAEVLIDGQRHSVSGTVCMDQFMVDVGRAGVEIGAIATLLGPDGDDRITAEELAGRIGTINYEITSRIASRVPRIYIGDTVNA
jgi:alanine racemase